MRQRLPNDPRCFDWPRCPPGVSHGSSRPERWVENGDKAPYWQHAESWSDIHEALAEGLLVFTHTGRQLDSAGDLVDGFITDHRQILIPLRLYELREQRAIDSILNQQ